MLLAERPEAEWADHWHFVAPDGRDLVGGPAAVMLLEYLHPTRYVGRLARVLRLTPLLHLGDALLDRMRPRLSLWVPNGRGPLRYP
ncbi:MAG TPA: hypothetical protein QF624_03105 [Dehalococcoidia bacterium]|nr:hypothetical protein [Dehalococcoidia bacterium]